MSNSSHKKQLIFSAVVVVGVAIFLGVYYFRTRDRAEPFPDPTLREAREAVLSKATFEIPAATSWKEIPHEELPASLAGLVLPNASQVNIEQGMYKSAKSGFRIGFSVPRSIADVHFEYLQKIQGLGWKMLMGNRTQVFAIIDLENRDFQARIFETGLGASQTRIEIEAIET